MCSKYLETVIINVFSYKWKFGIIIAHFLPVLKASG